MTMKRLFGFFFSALMFASACAGTSVNIVGSDDGTAIAGFDVVAFTKIGKAVPGDPKHAMEFDGARWIFSSEENLKSFQNNPESFKPAWGGHCAWAVSEKSISTKKLSGDFEVIDGKLYLFAFGNNKKSAAKDDFLYGRISRSARLRDGEQAWPEIEAGLKSGSRTQRNSKTYTKSRFE